LLLIEKFAQVTGCGLHQSIAVVVKKADEEKAGKECFPASLDALV